MARPPALPPAEKAKIIMRILTGAETVAEAARRAGVSEQAVGNWRRQFIEGGLIGLEGSAAGRNSALQEQMLAEIRELQAALGEAYVELRVWRKMRDVRRVPSVASR
jgi:transposase